MRVSLFIGTMASGGGGEKVLSMIANHMKDKGWDVDIVLMLSGEVNREHFNLNNKITILNLSSSQSYVKNSLSWIYRIRKYVNNYKPDVIVSFFGRISAVVLTATIGKRIPIIVSERSNPRRDGRGYLMLHYCDFIYHRAKNLVFQTKSQQSCFSNSHTTKSIIIPNPIKIIDVPNVPIEKDLVVTVGRLHPYKNQQMLIDAIEIVRKQVPNVMCILYGDGQLQEALNLSINKKGLQKNVILAGKKMNVLDYVARAKVFVMTSDLEGLSNALIEAMMLEKICITTDYEGADELINNGVNGIIVQRKNVQELADQLIKILLDTGDEYLVMGKNARKKIVSFNEKDVMRQWDSLIDSCIRDNNK